MRGSIVRKNWLNHVVNLYNPLLSKPVSPFYRISGFGKRNDDNDKLWSLEVLDKNSLVQIQLKLALRESSRIVIAPTLT